MDQKFMPFCIRNIYKEIHTRIYMFYFIYICACKFIYIKCSIQRNMMISKHQEDAEATSYNIWATTRVGEHIAWVYIFACCSIECLVIDALRAVHCYNNNWEYTPIKLFSEENIYVWINKVFCVNSLCKKGHEMEKYYLI